MSDLLRRAPHSFLLKACNRRAVACRVESSELEDVARQVMRAAPDRAEVDGFPLENGEVVDGLFGGAGLDQQMQWLDVECGHLPDVRMERRIKTPLYKSHVELALLDLSSTSREPDAACKLKLKP